MLTAHAPRQPAHFTGGPGVIRNVHSKPSGFPWARWALHGLVGYDEPNSLRPRPKEKVTIKTRCKFIGAYVHTSRVEESSVVFLCINNNCLENVMKTGPVDTVNKYSVTLTWPRGPPPWCPRPHDPVRPTPPSRERHLSLASDKRHMAEALGCHF